MKKKKELFTYLSLVVILFLVYLFSKSTALRYNFFSATFVSLVLEGLPFLLLGALVSSILHFYVPDSFFTKLNRLGIFLGIFAALLLGLFIPLCECAIIPVAARMIKKGLSPSIGLSFLFAAPIINPITIFSTYSAFSPDLSFAILRSLGGAVIVLIVGLFIRYIFKDKITVKNLKGDSEHTCNHHKTHSSKIGKISNHTLTEFTGLALFFIAGSFIASMLKTYAPQKLILSLGSDPITSIIAMMILAFVLSICSQADAFIAQSFYGIFSKASLLSFMIYGPMLDIKNTAVLLRHFEKKLVITLMVLISILTFGLTYLMGVFGV